VINLRVMLSALCIALGGHPLAAWADRPQVEAVVAQMQAAVLAHDSAGYLKLIDTRSPEFMQEQTNWAADLRKHPPSTFSLVLEPDAPDALDAHVNTSDPDDAPRRDQDVAEYTLVMTWSLASTDPAAPPTRRFVRIPARFTRDPALNTWRYAGEAWRVVTSDEHREPTDPDPAKHDNHHRARCLYLPGFRDAALRVVDILPGIRDHVHAGFELTVDHVQEVKLYPDQALLQASIYLSYTEPLGGWNEPGESIKLHVLPRTSAGELRLLLAHEYAHVATFAMGPNATSMPWWILEGAAELAAERYSSRSSTTADRARAFVRAKLKAGTLVPWAPLSDFRAVPGELYDHVYKQGHDFVGFVSQRFGRTRRNDWLRHLSTGASLNDATLAAFAMPFDEIDAAWRRSRSAPAEATRP
jgi:hypothetical protein